MTNDEYDRLSAMRSDLRTMREQRDTLQIAMQSLVTLVTGDLRESLHGESITPDDFMAQLRNVRGITLTLEAIAQTAISNSKI